VEKPFVQAWKKGFIPIMALFRRIIRFFKEDLWKIRARDLPAPRRYLVKFLKIFILAVRGFQQGGGNIRASALTLYTLLSIVPVLALLFGIAKGFGLEAKLQEWLFTQLPEQRELLGQALVFARRMLDSAQGGLVAGAGVVFLLYTVIRVISNIELAFNQIWSLSRARPWSRKFSDYLSLILVGPFLALSASSLNVYLAALVNRAAHAAPLSHLLNPLVRTGLALGPILLLWLLFTFIYVFLPHTKVRIGSGMIGGAVAALLYQMAQSLFIGLQVGASKANAVYGSFAALPLFLIWLQTSWNIVLFGAQLTYQHQNFESNEKDDHVVALSLRAVKRLALGVFRYVADRYLRGGNPPVDEEMARDLDVPARILSDILRRLVEAHILVVTAGPAPGETAYLPARDPHGLTPVDIIATLESQGEDLQYAQGDAGYSPLLTSFEDCLRKHPDNKRFGG
jgi:membrane protein